MNANNPINPNIPAFAYPYMGDVVHYTVLSTVAILALSTFEIFTNLIEGFIEETNRLKQRAYEVKNNINDMNSMLLFLQSNQTDKVYEILIKVISNVKKDNTADGRLPLHILSFATQVANTFQLNGDREKAHQISIKALELLKEIKPELIDEAYSHINRLESFQDSESTLRFFETLFPILLEVQPNSSRLARSYLLLAKAYKMRFLKEISLKNNQ